MCISAKARMCTNPKNPGEKELVWADGTHCDYYDSQARIDNAVANVTRFFRTHLAKELAA